MSEPLAAVREIPPPDPARPRVLSIIGTRPEAIKMAPVVWELKRHPGVLDTLVVTTAQHREMLAQSLADFEIEPDVDLQLMTTNQSLGDFASRALASLSHCFQQLQPTAVLVQGDTTSAAMAALGAFYRNAAVGHIEAGLRSFEKRDPFPEEANRRIISSVADLHFAPTERARENLLREGIPPQDIFVTGNTIVDALESAALAGPMTDPVLERLASTRPRIILLTAHRRENIGPRLYSICRAVKELVNRFADIEVVFPVHLNPNVRSIVFEELSGISRIHLVDPVSHSDLLRLMRRSYLVMTDSGGVQEEAPSFRKPVLILRETTERPELVEAGGGLLVGTDADWIVTEASRLLADEVAYAEMRQSARNPFGEGNAAEQIVKVLSTRLLLGAEAPAPVLVDLPQQVPAA